MPPVTARELYAQQLDDVLQAQWRSVQDRALDAERFPRKTLEFFAVRPDSRVIELMPEDGWYARILASWLAFQGQFAVAVPKGAEQTDLEAMFSAHPARYGGAMVLEYDPAAPQLGDSGSAECVLSFHGMHHWLASGNAQTMLEAVYTVLQPGGVFGVVETSREADAEAQPGEWSGEVSQALLVRIAAEAGLELDQATRVSSTPGSVDQGLERMVLRFVKPVPSVTARAGSAGMPDSSR